MVRMIRCSLAWRGVDGAFNCNNGSNEIARVIAQNSELRSPTKAFHAPGLNHLNAIIIATISAVSIVVLSCPYLVGSLPEMQGRAVELVDQYSHDPPMNRGSAAKVAPMVACSPPSPNNM